MKTEVKIRDEERLLLELCRLEFSDEHLKDRFSYGNCP